MQLISSGGGNPVAPFDAPYVGYPENQYPHEAPHYGHHDEHLTHASHPALHFDHPPAHEHEHEHHYPEHLHDAFGREFTFVPEHHGHDDDFDYYMPHRSEHEMYSHY